MSDLRARVLCIAAGGVLATGLSCAAPAIPPLVVAGRISLGEVRGRIDHLAVDLARDRVFVAEYGNDSVSVADYRARQVIRRLAPLSRPQGIAYLPVSDMLVVAAGGNGTVHLFRGEDLTVVRVLDHTADADNVRVAPTSGEALVGYGDGALAVLDGATGRQVSDIPLPGHPESFQLETTGSRVFVNIPDVAQIAVVDRLTHKRLGHWGLANAAGNFAMAFDERQGWLWVVYRQPGRVAVLSSRDGTLIANLPACTDADDAFVDDKRQQVYISCGEGVVQVLSWHGDVIREIGRVATATGARTALFVPELDELIVAVPAQGREPAALWLMRPTEASRDAGGVP